MTRNPIAFPRNDRTTPDTPIFGSALVHAAQDKTRDDEKFYLCAAVMAHELNDYARMAHIDAKVTPMDVAGSMAFNEAYRAAIESGFDSSTMIQFNSATRDNIRKLSLGKEPSDCPYLNIINELQSTCVPTGRYLQVGADRMMPYTSR